jgi:hypothetical protein
MGRWLGVAARGLFAAVVVAALWSARYRYDHITVQSDRYIVRIHRLTGHADILVPETGWVPAEERWDDVQDEAPESTT